MKRIDIDSSGFERVVSVEHVIRLAAERRACYHTWHCRIYPAAALANWQAKILHDSINDGIILIYPKPGKAKKCITKKLTDEATVEVIQLKLEELDELRNEFLKTYRSIENLIDEIQDEDNELSYAPDSILFFDFKAQRASKNSTRFYP